MEIGEKLLEPSLRMFMNILEKYLKNEWAHRRYRHIPNTIIKENQLLSHLNTYYYLLTVIDPLLFQDVTQLIYCVHLIEMCTNSESYLINREEETACIDTLVELIEKAIVKHQAITVTWLCFLTIKHWCMIHSRFEGEMPVNEEDFKTWAAFQLQISALQLVPIFMFLEERYELSWQFVNPEVDSLNFSMEKFMPKICTWTIELGNRFRRVYMDFLEAVKALQHIQLSIPYYDRKTAVVVFQGLVYAFDVCNTVLLMNQRKRKIGINVYGQFYSNLCIVLRELIEKFNLVWADCPPNISLVFISSAMVQDEFLTTPVSGFVD